MHRTLGLAALALAVALSGGSAVADPDVTAVSAAPTPHRHAVYLEVLGKGGLWGAGYDYLAWPRVAFGATVSGWAHDGERILSLSPYVALYPLGGARHRGFVQLGPQLVRLDRMSPVPEWPGQSESGIGAEVSAGYELRTRVLLRAFAMVSAGDAGVAPWIGISAGVTL